MVSTLVVQNTQCPGLLYRGDLLWSVHQLYKAPNPQGFSTGGTYIGQYLLYKIPNPQGFSTGVTYQGLYWFYKMLTHVNIH